MIDADVVSTWKTPAVRQSYGPRDSILYALGVGAGRGAADLQYVYEAQLRALPTMAVTLACEPFWFSDARTGIDWKKLLHGEQRLEIHNPLPPEGEVIGQMEVDHLFDRGPGRGAVLALRRSLRNAASGELIATARMTAMLMGDGGFGGSAEGMPKAHRIPERNADLSVSFSTLDTQALIYRLSGDYNPLHVDPVIARYAGFERPILHGLCSYGIAGRAIIQTLCADDPHRLQQLDVRFTSPVYPGETLVIDIWHEGADSAAFRCRILEREVVAVNNGYARYKAA